MKLHVVITGVVVGLAWFGAAPAVHPLQDQRPAIQVPNPGVPQIMTLEGEFVRVAYNNEGYVSLGYRVANMSVGEEWMMIEIGATVREGRPNYALTRDAISLETPDGTTIPMPSNSEYQAQNLRAIEQRAAVVRDSVGYFPPGANRACRIGFFLTLESRTRAYDDVELSWQRACVGRLYFHVPGGIKYGQHWLNVKFKDSVVRAPFRILTDEEKEVLSKNWKDIKKQVEEAFKKGGA